MPKQVPAFEALGLQVDFYCRRLRKPEIPRIGWVTGAGETNTERAANLTFFHHPIIDVANGQKAMLGTARGVPIYDENFAKGDQSPVHYAIIRQGQQAAAQFAPEPDEDPHEDGDDLGDLSRDNEIRRREPGEDPEPEPQAPAKGKKGKPQVSVIEDAVRKLLDDEQCMKAAERIEAAECKSIVDANGATFFNSSNFAFAVLSFSEDRPGDGFTLETLLPNGRGMELILKGINNVKKTRPGLTVFALMDYIAELCEAADGQNSIKAVGSAIKPVADQIKAAKK